jgi:hypothetical protein
MSGGHPPSRGGRIIGLEEDAARTSRSLSGSGGSLGSGYSAGSGSSNSNSSSKMSDTAASSPRAAAATASAPRRRLHAFDRHLKEAALERSAVGLVVARVLDDGRPVAERLVPDYRREDLKVYRVSHSSVCSPIYR